MMTQQMCPVVINMAIWINWSYNLHLLYFIDTTFFFLGAPDGWKSLKNYPFSSMHWTRLSSISGLMMTRKVSVSMTGR